MTFLKPFSSSIVTPESLVNNPAETSAGETNKSKESETRIVVEGQDVAGNTKLVWILP